MPTILYLSSNSYIWFNQLSGTIPSSIGSLAKLQYLYVKYNHLINDIKAQQSPPCAHTHTHTHTPVNELMIGLPTHTNTRIFKQVSQRQSTQWRHSIIDWISREP